MTFFADLKIYHLLPKVSKPRSKQWFVSPMKSPNNHSASVRFATNEDAISPIYSIVFLRFLSLPERKFFNVQNP